MLEAKPYKNTTGQYIHAIWTCYIIKYEDFLFIFDVFVCRGNSQKWAAKYIIYWISFYYFKFLFTDGIDAKPTNDAATGK